MSRTRISTKGQIVLPKEVRERQGWAPGTELDVEAEGEVVLLRPVRSGRRMSAEEVYGCLKWDGPPKTIEEMDQGVAEQVRERWDEFERQRE